MAQTDKTCDVFVSHSAGDAPLALEVAAAFRANGLEPVAHAELESGPNAGDALWEALAESRALLTILSPSGLTPSMAVEIGAARAWNKPIFAVTADPSTQLPPALTGTHVYTVGRIDEVIRAIKLSGQQLSDEDRSLLAKFYARTGVPVDQLALSPRSLEKLIKRFHVGSGKSMSGERLLSELLRMRKQGKLPRIRSASRAGPRKGTA